MFAAFSTFQCEIFQRRQESAPLTRTAQRANPASRVLAKTHVTFLMNPVGRGPTARPSTTEQYVSVPQVGLEIHMSFASNVSFLSWFLSFSRAPNFFLHF